MQLRATSLSAGSSAIGAKQSSIAKMISTLRRIGGTLIYAPDNALGDGAPNLLSAPEDFSDAAWTKASAAIVPAAGTAPDGTTSAQLFYPTSTGTFRVVRRASGAGNPWSGSNTFTIHAKAAGLTRIGFLNAVGNNAGASVNLTTGAVTIVDASLTVSVDALPDDWYRCKVTAAAGWVYAYLTDTDTGITVTANGTSGIHIWGAKLEPGSVATAYTPQSVLRTRGVYQDIAGTTPVTAVGDLIGKVLDKTGTNHATQSAVASKPSVQRVPKRLGPNLVAPPWLNTYSTAFDTFSQSGSSGFVGTTTGAKTGVRVGVPCSFEAGKSYQIDLNPTLTNASISSIWFSDAALSDLQAIQNPAVSPYRVVFTTASARTHCMLILNTTGAGTVSVPAFTVQEVLEWANVISFDGSNDFLQTGITTGNEGFVAAGVTFGGAAGANETVFASGAGSAPQKGVWLLRNSTASALRMRVGNGTALTMDTVTALPLLNVPRVVEGGWDASTVIVGVDGITSSKAKTGDVTAPGTALVGAFLGGILPLQGPMHAIAYAPVLPDAATRKIIRDGIAALQGRGPL